MKSAFRVSICGGGIGGLMLAVVIGRYGTLPVEVFEAGPVVTTAGAGISVFARTMDIMKEMGLYDEFVKLDTQQPQEPPGSRFRKSDQQDGYHWFSRHATRRTLSLHRKDLIDFLLRHIPASCKIHTSKRLESYDANSETGQITLHFSDGSTTITDVLVGADGIRSATRKTMYQNLASFSEDENTRTRLLECIDPVWTGILVYRSLVPTAKLPKGFPGARERTMYAGRNKHIIAYPISQGQLINVVIFIDNSSAFGTKFEGRWVVNVSETEVSDQFEDWEDRVGTLVKSVEKPSRWALHFVRPLPHYVDGKAALLGDAAHAMEPHFAAGAGQSVEDAFVLGRLLTHELTDRSNLIDALKMYEEIRLPFANSVTQSSRDVGRYYFLQHVSEDGSVPAEVGPEELDYVRKSIAEAWRWQGEPSLAQWNKAEERWRAECSMRAKL